MRLTVFTPSYNRADRLPALYESLKKQRAGEFMWLIVDDGSTDDTADVIKRFADEDVVDIKYIRQENGGKMRAHNTGVKACDTELFLCVDSDDHLSEGAVDDILDTWDAVGNREDCAGIIAYKGESETEPLYGDIFPDIGDCSFRELYRMGFSGETTLVLRTDLLKMHLFPEIPGEKYVPEDVVYDRIDEGHFFRLVPKIFTVCELVEKGLTDRAAELRREAPTGWFIYYSQRAKAWPVSAKKIKFAAHYLRFEKLVDIKYREKYALPMSLRIAGYPGSLILALMGKL